MFFHSWHDLARPLIVGALAYVALVALLRVSGKRTLTKLNAFDLVITVALGSTFATVLLSKDVALAEGVVALGLLVALQYLVTFTTVRWHAAREIVKGEPSLLFFRGSFLEDAMRAERVLKREIQAAVRQRGVADLSNVEAVVLETNGDLSVVARDPDGKHDALAGIPRYERRYGEPLEL